MFFGNKSLKKANTTIEMLIALFVVTIVFSLMLPIFKITKNNIVNNDAQKILSQYKVQALLAQSKIVSVRSNLIEIVFNHEHYQLQLERNRLVKKPGYHILMNDIKAVFELRGACIYLNDKKLYCEKGIR